MLGGLTSLASKPEGANNLWSALQGLQQDSHDDYLSMLTGGKESMLSDIGGKLLMNLFGKQSTNSLVDALSGFLGGGKSTWVSKLLSMLAPMVLGYIGKQVKSGNLDLAGLVKMLMGQRSNIASAMPSGLMNSLSGAQGLGAFGNFVDDAKDLADGAQRQAAAATRAATSTAAQSSASSMGWLLPLILLAAAIGIIYWLMNRPAGDEGVKDGVQSATEKVVDSASELSGDFTKMFSNMDNLLQGVTNVETANAALPKLKEMESTVNSLAGSFEALPSAGKSTLSKVINDAMGGLRKERDRVEQIPGVGDILKSVLEQIFEKLTSLIR